MPILPFHFKLKKLSGADLRLVDAIYSFLPRTGLRDSFMRGITESIARHVGEGFSMRFESFSRERFSTWLSRIPQSPAMAVIGLAPISRAALLEIDAPLAMLFVDRLLGGQSESCPDPRPLSDTEQGVLEYLVLQVIAHVHDQCGKDARVQFRFERFVQEARDLRDIVPDDCKVAVLVFRVEIGRFAGFVRLYLPDPFVEEGLLDVESSDEVRPAERAFMLGQLQRFSYVRCPIWAEAGSSALSLSDLANLEEGDIILFDRSEASLAGNRPEGRVLLKLGTGIHGGIDADLSIEGTHARCRIVGLHKGE